MNNFASRSALRNYSLFIFSNLPFAGYKSLNLTSLSTAFGCNYHDL
jgi:hypothetical protein